MTLKTWLCGNGNTEWNTKHPHRSIHEFICILITLRTSLTISGLSLRIMQNLWDLSRMQQSSYPVSTLTPMQKFLSQDMCALCLSSIQPGLLYKFGDQRWPRMASVTAKDSELDNSYRPRVPHTTWVIGQKRPVDIDKMFWCHFVILGVLVSYHRSSPRPRAKQTSQGDLRSAWQCRVVQHGTKVTTLQRQHLHSSSTIVPAPRLLSHPHAMWRLTPRVYTLIKILKLRAHCPKHCLEKIRWDLFVVINTVCYLPQIWIPPGIASNCSSTVKLYTSSKPAILTADLCVCWSKYEHTTDCEMASWSTAFAVPSAAPADLKVLLFDISWESPDNSEKVSWNHGTTEKFVLHVKEHHPCLHLVPWLWRKQLPFGKSRLGTVWDHQLSPAFLPRSWPKSCKACALRIRICQGLETIPMAKVCSSLPTLTLM